MQEKNLRENGVKMALFGDSLREEDLIKFTAIVEKIQTLKDGGLRLTLDLPEDATGQAKALMDVKALIGRPLGWSPATGLFLSVKVVNVNKFLIVFWSACAWR